MRNLPYQKEINNEVVKLFINEHPFLFLSGSYADNKPVSPQVLVFIEDEMGNCY